MKTKITFALLVLVFLSGNSQIIWTGPITTFERVNVLGLNITLAENQDRITENVWITRASSQGIFNIKTENSYADFMSPADTEWAFGTTANIGITFNDWETTIASSPPDMVGLNMVLHLITDDIYIDIKFLSWASGKSGGYGGFSYERSTDQNLGTNDFELNKALHVFPNPSQNFIQITGLTNTQNFKMHNILGVKVLEDKIEPNKKIDIKNLGKGIYFVHFENGATLKFIKQ